MGPLRSLVGVLQHAKRAKKRVALRHTMQEEMEREEREKEEREREGKGEFVE